MDLRQRKGSLMTETAIEESAMEVERAIKLSDELMEWFKARKIKPADALEVLWCIQARLGQMDPDTE